MYIGQMAFAKCPLQQIHLPDSLKSIGEGAFEKCTELTSVDIPAEIKIIEPNAFEGCTSLKSVTFPDGLMRIGDRAFQFTCLVNVELPDSLKEIGAFSFYTHKTLQSVNIPRGIECIERYAFSGGSEDITFNIPEYVSDEITSEGLIKGIVYDLRQPSR